MSGFAPRVKAVLGPTNTGKTHLALERLSAHASGIIGFPLRLLARENYDRLVREKGPARVALITGEEKIVPPDARWFSCTVEAMPLDRPVEFLAVDEIQLCADPDRGHIFTDRLLRARGLVETMFLGAETIRPLLARLVPGVFVETRPRLSQLHHAGPAKLTKLPPRSAVVAFSAAEVYAIAEAIRRRRGGCAVVMGRLSPRTRNAQVALYQEKEVDFLVATDAIGMGLNMDVDHVAFAGLRKHDGHRLRPLAPAELAQIAGRAGRGMRDGTFGTTAASPPMEDELAAAVEAHRFESLTQLCWRNSDLDFSGIDALLGSLTTPPGRPGLVRGNDASDLETLSALAREPEIRRRAAGRVRLRRLWEACQIPDFRKLADETHTRLCARIFEHVADGGTVPTDFLAAQIAHQDRPDGDMDTLMQRLSGIRVWAYIAARADWVRDAPHWQATARAVEDKLSDALHERLLARFVDRRAAVLLRRLEAGDGSALLSAVTRRGEVVVEGQSVGDLSGFAFHPDPETGGDARKLVLRAARRALHSEMPRRVAAAEDAPDSAFALIADQRIAWDGHKIARLRPGATALRPQVEMLDSEFLDGAQRERLRARLQRFLDARIETTLAPLFRAEAAAAGDPALRGVLHVLAEALGCLPDGGAHGADPALRARLKPLGVTAGRFALFLPALLKPGPAALRAQLWALREAVAVPAPPPSAGAIALAPPEDWPAGFATAMGWLPAGPVALRADVAERVAAELAYAVRRGAAVLPPGLAGRLGVRGEWVPAVLRVLGYRVVPGAWPGDKAGTGPTDEPAHAAPYGPPAPALLMPLRRRDAPRLTPPVAVPRPAPRAPANTDGPFAALAALIR